MKLGYAHPDYLLDDLSSSQLSEWEAFNKLNPIGEWRQDYRMALLTSVVTNLVKATNTKRGQDPKYTVPLDFLPDWGGRKEGEDFEIQSTEEMRSFLLSFASSHNKNVKRNTRPPRRPKKLRRK